MSDAETVVETEASSLPSAVSFDDLDQAYDSVKEPEPTEEVKEDETIDSSEVVEDGPKEESEESEDELQEDSKVIKIKDGDREIALKSDAKIPVKVDGKSFEVSIEDLRQDYAGREAIKTRFDEFSREKQSYVNDKKVTEDFLNSTIGLMQTDPIRGIAKIAEKAGFDPVQYQMTLLDQLAEQGQKWAQMNETEKKVWQKTLEADTLKARLEQLEASQNSSKEIEQLDVKVKSIVEELGVSEQDFAETYFDLERMQVEGGLSLEITPELVQEAILDQQLMQDASAIFGEVAPAFKEDDEALNTLVGIYYEHPNLTREDFVELAKDYAEQKRSIQISQKIQKSEPQRVRSRGSVNAGQEPLTFDDLDKLF